MRTLPPFSGRPSRAPFVCHRKVPSLAINRPSLASSPLAFLSRWQGMHPNSFVHISETGWPESMDPGWKFAPCEIRVSSAAPCSLHFDATTRAGSLWSMLLRRTYRSGRRTIWPCFSSRTYSRSVFCRCFFLHTKQSTDGGVCLFMYHHVLLRLYFFRND
jgi:hypothetical protein